MSEEKLHFVLLRPIYKQSIIYKFTCSWALLLIRTHVKNVTMIPINAQSITLVDSSGATRAGKDVPLPSGTTIQATVKQVAQDQLDPKIFRVRLEANSTLLELKTPQPLATGTQVTLSRNSEGRISIFLNQAGQAPSQNNSKTTQAPSSGAPAIPARTFQAPVVPRNDSLAEINRLEQIIPRGQLQTALVITQNSAPIATQATPTPAQTPPAQAASTPAQTTPSAQAAPTPAQTPSAQATPAPAPTSPSAQATPAPVQTTPPAQATPAPAQTSPSAQATPTPAQTAPPLQATPAPVQTSSAHIVSSQVTTQPLEQPVLPKHFPQTQPYSTGGKTGDLQLNIKGETVSFKAPANLPPLKEVQVGRTAEQIFIRWSLPTTNTPAPLIKANIPVLTSTQQDLVQTTLRENLPIQQPMADNLQQLTNLLQLSAQNPSPQTDKLIQSILQLFGVRPGAKESGEQVKQNVQFGGLFTESRLAKKQPVHQDLKQFLGKLKQNADSLPPLQRESTLHVVDKILARVTSQQLQAAQPRQEKSESIDRIFQLDLPIKHERQLENVELRIGRSQRKNSAGHYETIWNVQLHFDLKKAGAIDVDISLNQQHQTLTTAFICEEASTASHVRQQLDSFKTQLEKSGFSNPLLACRTGKSNADKQTLSKQLIDIKT